MTIGDPLESRVLLLAPTGRDSELTIATLEEATLRCTACATGDQLCREIVRGVGALLVTEEALTGGLRRRLANILSTQSPWSDLPILVLTWPGADSWNVADAVVRLGNVSLIERPVRVSALVSTVRAALRSRERQYQIRAHLDAQHRSELSLREADRRKDEFLATLAHELRNPLAPLRNSLFILQSLGESDENTRRLHAMMERQVDHMVRLVDDLLEISRIERGKIELRREIVDVASIVRTASETSQPLIDAGGHTLELDVPSSELFLDADPVRLAQVIANLLNNAAKYTEDGGRISLRAWRDGGLAVISVRDNGTGIPKEMLPNVFDMFMQVGAAGTRAKGGLGIGLTLVRTLVQMHGGTVEAQSEGVGRGSEFTVRLPLIECHESPGDRPDERGEPGLSSMRVLVVDDNRDAADSLGMLLGHLGAEVKVAHDGEAALAVLGDYHPGAVLLDIGMPGLDGYETARRIRSQPRFHDVALIALTGWGQAEDRRRSSRAGFDHHLTKPADAAALRHLLLTLASRPPRQSAPDVLAV